MKKILIFFITENLQVESTVIKTSVESLVNLLIECSQSEVKFKYNISLRIMRS